MSLIYEYLNVVKLGKQNFNFGCRAARDNKEVRYWNNKSKSVFLNWNIILSYNTMTITIDNNIITNKLMSTLRSVRYVSPLATFISTVKPVCNDHLYYKLYYLLLIQ